MHRDIVQQFKVGAWRSAAEAQAWAGQLAVDVDDLIAMLEIVVQKVPAIEAERAAMRRAVFAALVKATPSDQLFRPMARAIRVSAPEARPLLVELLPKVNNVAEHQELVDLLRVPDSEVRQAAAKVLVEAGSKGAIASITSMVVERGFVGFREGLEVVMRTSGHHGIPLLEKLASRPDSTQRLLAIRWLGDAQHMARATGAAMRVLQPLLHDTHESIAIAAAIAIGQIASEADAFAILVPFVDGKNLKLAGTIIEGMKRFPTQKTADLLERKLASGPNVLRLACLSAVENAIITTADAGGDFDPFLGVVVKALGHHNIAVRNRAGEVMTALSASENVEVGRTIVWLLRSGDVTTRRMAADVLRTISDPHGDLWPKLISSLRDDDWWVREAVMDALLELAGNGLSRYMVAWLKDGSDVVRRFALSVLARLKDPETIAAVVHCARTDSDWWARERAVEVIAEFKDPRAIPIIVELMAGAPELQMTCIQAIRTIDPEAAKPHLLPLLKSSEADVRLLVLRSIEERNDPAHQNLVEPLVNDTDPAVSRLAHALLVRWRVVKEQSIKEAGAVPPPISADIAVDDQRTLDELLMKLFDDGGDDLIIAPDRPVFMKRHGEVVPVTPHPLSADRVASLLMPLVSAQMAMRLDQKKDVDFSMAVKTTGQRLRANFFRQRGGLSGVFRAIRAQIPQLESLGLPSAVRELMSLRTGLVLVGGATSSGKSTTLAAFIDAINRTQPRHVISIEDPIEIVHGHTLALVQQRELGSHTRSYARALKSALRQDPDVIVIGELRDRDSIELALTAAETGHLVLATLHTVSADACIDRVINGVGKNQQDQARASLADSLRAILCQTLVRRKPGTDGPRLLASELLINTDAVANIIRKGKTVQLPSIIATSREQGMQSMDNDLIRLVKGGAVDEIDVLSKARNKVAVEAAIAEARSERDNVVRTGKITPVDIARRT
jgi:twitching motility protein PilT